MAHPFPPRGRDRAVIEGLEPSVDGGRFPSKAVRGRDVRVEADAFADGHDALDCRLLYRHESEETWTEAPMELLGNDRWVGRFPAERLGRYLFTVTAWTEPFLTWRKDLVKRIAADQDLEQPLLVGADLVEAARNRARESGGSDAEDDARALERWVGTLQALAADPWETSDEADPADSTHPALRPELRDLMARHPDRSRATTYHPSLPVEVDRERGGFSAWYELFPRSTGPEGSHGTFRDVIGLLPEIAAMGFDVVYLPPIHPIGRTKRKGPNNRIMAGPDDPGSPWAIGSEEGGHKSIHSELGTLADFRALVEAAREHGMEIALDMAFQCSPDHPWVEEHPDWFRRRPDGSIQYAENPPKKYEDIYPLDFECASWEELWEELASVFEFWMDRGVKAFRVDNPHTKPFAFWEWVIERLRSRDPEVLLLSEAFTRPKIMYRLAKVGFSQSYTYFTWRNEAPAMRAYLEELTRSEARHFFRPNFWPNTPDILHEYLQTGGRAAFESRLILAATLSSNYGIYGPAFELQEAAPREPGSEEYRDSEKYEIRTWDRAREDSLARLVSRVNEIRRENPALQRTDNLRFHSVDNDEILVYSKRAPESENRILVAVSFDPDQTREAWVELDLEALGLEEDEEFVVHDRLDGIRYEWKGRRNYVKLGPEHRMAHVFRIETPKPPPTTETPSPRTLDG